MISIVIPLYNKEKSVSSTIDSALSQTFSEFEIIVVNDGSTDNSINIIQGIKDDRVKLINIENGGVSRARNIGVDNAKFELIALLDADDLWDENYLEEMYKFILDFPEASLWGSVQRILAGNDIKILDYSIPSNFRGYVDNYFKVGIENTLFHTSSVIFRKSDFLAVGKFDENIGLSEDMDLWFRFAIHTRVAFYNKPMAYYRVETENRSMTLSINKAKKRSLIYNLEKYKQFEKHNPDLTTFLDSFRYLQVKDYLEGTRFEIDDARPILKDITLFKLPIIFRIIKFCPKFVQKSIYIYYKSLYVLFRKIKNILVKWI